MQKQAKLLTLSQHIFMKISQTIDIIINNITLIIKTRQINFTNILSLNSSLLWILSYYVLLSLYQTTHQTYSSCLMILSTTFLLRPFAFLISLLSIVTKEYIFDFSPTNNLSSNLYHFTNHFFIINITKSRIFKIIAKIRETSVFIKCW